MPTLISLVTKLVADTDQYKRDMDSAHNKAKELGDGMTSTGAKMTAGVTLPLLALGIGAFDAASDVNESMSKVDVVFGQSAESVKAFADSAALDLGMSEGAALSAAGTYGNLFTAMGIGESASADMSTGLIQLAADLASFNNLDPTVVLDKLRAGLTGETEPLKSLGVNMNAATLEAKAMEMGLMTQGEELSASAKAQAAFAIIMQQTGKAQGDFTRTSEGAANQTRIAKAQFSDIAATLGTQLLPIGIKLIGFVNDLLGRFGALEPQTQTIILVVAGLAAGIGPLLATIGTLISIAGAVGPVLAGIAGIMTFPLGAVIIGLVAIIAGLALAWKNNWGDIRGKTEEVINFLKPFIENALAGVKMVFEAFSLAFSGDWEGFGAKLREIWNTAWENIKAVFTAAWDWFTGLDWGQIGLGIINGIINGISGSLQFLIDAANGIGEAVMGTIKGFFGIRSPSERAKREVGWHIGGGVIEGYRLRMRDFASGLSMPAFTQVTSSRPVIVSLAYNPMMSLADRYEAENVLKPFIEQGVRAALAGG